MERLAVLDQVLESIQNALWKEHEQDNEMLQESGRRVSNPSISTPSVPQSLSFTPDKSLFVKLDPPVNTTACHAPGGKGYCLTEQGISGSSGCYTWTFIVSKETKGNEGTCIGVSIKDPSDYSHRYIIIVKRSIFAYHKT
jgi:hypothetical protein